MGDDAADGQRGEPAAAERAQLPGRDSAAAVLRSRRAGCGRTTARSARSSATRSATASTTRAALFDAQGRLANWWTHEDFAHFEASGAQLAAQYDAYTPFPDLHVNGKQTLSENIADLAGLAAAYDAWLISLSGAHAPASAGLTGEQQFFLSYAQSWRSKSREAALRQQIITDGHAPDAYRAATVRNIDAWYDAVRREAGPAALPRAERTACASGESPPAPQRTLSLGLRSHGSSEDASCVAQACGLLVR